MPQTLVILLGALVAAALPLALVPLWKVLSKNGKREPEPQPLAAVAEESLSGTLDSQAQATIDESLATTLKSIEHQVSEIQRRMSKQDFEVRRPLIQNLIRSSLYTSIAHQATFHCLLQPEPVLRIEDPKFPRAGKVRIIYQVSPAQRAIYESILSRGQDELTLVETPVGASAWETLVHESMIRIVRTASDETAHLFKLTLNR